MADQWHVGSTEDQPCIYLWDEADQNLMATVEQEPSERWTATIARARRIVTCVNTHDALLAAATRLAADLDSQIEAAICVGLPPPVFDWLAKLKAAVSAAEGKG